MATFDIMLPKIKISLVIHSAKMATQSGGVDWSSTIKPILAILQGTNISKSELIDLIHALSKSDAEFQDYDASQENFFTPLAILSAHLIASNTSYLSSENLSTLREASSVIIRHLLLKLALHNGITPEGPPAQTISIKQLLIPLASLCGSEDTVLSHADIIVLALLLKESKVPINNTSGWDASKPTGQSSERAASQRRADGLAEVLTGPLPRASAAAATPAPALPPRHAPPPADPAPPAKTTLPAADVTVTADAAPQPALDTKKWLTEACTSILCGLGAGGTLIELCGALPCLQRHLTRFRAARDGSAAACPYQHHSADAALVSLLVSEVGVCQMALSLPCLEPLTASRVAVIADVSAAWLLCATAHAAVHLKDEEAEAFAAALVEGALRLFNTVGEVLKNSTRAGGYVYQNHLMIGTWVLLSGLHQSLMGAGGAQGTTPPHTSKSPARAPSRPYNLARIQQGVHVTWVALGSRCLEGVRALLADARLEAGAADAHPEAAAHLDPLQPNSAGQRAARLALCAPLHQVLVVLGVVCYRKATSLKRAVVHKQHEQDADRSDSTVYYQDMIMCSEDSETDDEDSEPLLGLWFEATLVAPDGGEGGGGGGADSGNDSQDPSGGSSQPGLVPDKAEPYSYISLATEVFSLLNGEVLGCGPRVGGTLQESQVALLAALVRDLDRETARTDTGTISPCFGARLGALYGEFSAALVRYLHSLTGSSQLGALRQILLEHLGAAPPAPQEQAGLMPLQVGCRVVKLIGAVILAKPVAERETAILSLWNRTVSTVVECALQPQPSQDHEYEDMNVEHAQLLVYLFHSLNLMQKKSVLLMTANAIIKVSDALGMPDGKRASQVAPHQLMLTTRLLLLFEYLMKHLYDAPPWLLHQIFWNLAAAPGLVPVEAGQTPPGASAPSRTYCSVPHIEQAYRRRVSQDADVSMRPKFYSVADATFSNQETPKLDGLACNFVLGTPDKLKYPLLLDGLLGLLRCAGVCDRQPPPALPAACAAHYCFQTAWRLLITLPPSTPHVERMSEGREPLHALVWAPRAAHHKTFGPWLKDALVKQGMYTQSAENLLSGVAASCDNISYTVWLATQTIQHLRDNIGEWGLPCLWDVMTVDCVLMRLRVSLCDEAQVAALAAAQPDAHLTRQFMPHLLDLMETLFECCRTCSVRESGGADDSAEARTAEGVLRCCGTRGAPWLRAHLPPATRSALDRIAAAPAADMSPNSFLNDAIPSESAVLQLLTLHCQLMSYGGSGPPLQLLASGAVELLAARVASLLDPERAADRDRAVSLLLPATVDARLEFLQKTAWAALSALLPTAHRVEQALHEEVLRGMYPVMRDCPSPANEKILRSMVKYWEKVLERPAGRSALESLHTDGEVFLGRILVSAHDAGQPYAARVVKLLNKLFASCDSSDGVPSPICGGLCRSAAASASARPDFSPGTEGDDATDADLELAAVVADGLTPAWLSHLCLGAALPPRAAASTPSDSDPATPTAPPVAPAPSASVAVSQPANRDLREPNEGSDDSSPAPRNGHADPTQQSESCSWSGGASDSKESVAVALMADAADNTDNATLLANLTKHTIAHCDRATSLALLQALVSLTGEALGPSHAGLPLPRLLREAARLADAHSGLGHRLLFPAALQWLDTCVESLCAPDVLDRLEEGGASPSQRSHLDAACHLLAYVTDALHAAGGGEAGLAPAPAALHSVPAGLAWDVGDVPPLDADWPDDAQDDDDTSADDSDEDSMLHLKLCTFTTTAREFMNQHWYHCHTCKMVDGVGVCTVCALVCHRSHDVSYAKFGNFFCDCGAKEDSSCQALVKRSSSQSLSRRGADSSERVPPCSSLRRRPSSPPRSASPPTARRPAYASNLQGARDWIASQPRWAESVESLQRLLAALAAPVKASCERHAAVGRHGRARRALAQLHHGDKRFHTTDQLMVPTLGSQEGAFENVRMSYTGEQGQAIRQLISAHMVRRVAMCCLALPHGRRQNLAVSHEKGKVTILQLSALLKQADSSKRKLTLTRLTSAPIPFTVLTLSANPWNEDVLAVCGLRECHVITFNGSGSVYDRLVMQPALDPGNFIIRGIWLPGEQTALALVTADFVKIYDLSKDASQPEYHFLVPSGKVRDVTFVTQESGTFMLCMGSAGHIYWQAMNRDSHASNGPFYITNTVDVQHNDIKDVTGQVGGGGVSIYYSHTLKILFFSYAQGKSFMAPLVSVEDTLKGVSLMAVGGTQKEGARGGKGAQSLCQWQEVPGHPGLVTAVLQASNNPVVIMLKPGSVAVQEIKVVPAKAKITDMVAVRHSSGQQEHKTTLILLCEDGSLRIYAASPDHTGFWLSPAVAPPALAAPPAPQPAARARRARHPPHHRAKTAQSSGKPGAALSFPIDFFEHCAGLADVEFGGNDLLQVYNTAQIKHRLNTNSLYVVSTKPSGFVVEVTNSDPAAVITGIRVLLGNQDVHRTPAYIEVCGRVVQTPVSRSRWYDIPLTREESLLADKKLSITFGSSQDPEGVIMVDSIKVYGRNKEAFGWPEESEDSGACNSNGKVAQEAEGGQSAWTPPGVERLACSLLEALELCLAGGRGETGRSLEVATGLLCAPCPPPIHTRAKALLRALLGADYHHHRDEAMLSHVTEQLRELWDISDPRNADPENFFRLVLLARGVAVSRPTNLIKYAGPQPGTPLQTGEWYRCWSEGAEPSGGAPRHLAPLLAGVLWRMESVRSPSAPAPSLAPLDRSGLRHTEHVLHAFVDVMHALMINSDDAMVEMGNRIYLSLLLAKDQVVSFGAKAAIVRALRPRIKKRRVYIPSPPATPGAAPEGTGRPGSPGAAAAPATPPADHNDNEPGHFAHVDQVVDMSRLLGADGAGLEALLGIPADADDETMVELAIVLSLQEGGEAAPSPSPSASRRLRRPQQRAPPRSGAASDATASAAGSDDEEGAGVGANPPESPGEHPGSAGSESGSGADSIGGVSGRSSAYGEAVARQAADAGASDSSRWAGPSGSGADGAPGGATGAEAAARLRRLRLELLKVLLAELPRLRDLPGLRTIPFMQVLLMLANGLDTSIESEQAALRQLLTALVSQLDMNPLPVADEPATPPEDEAQPVQMRTPTREMQLLIMRLLSVLMSRWKPPANGGASPAPASLEYRTAAATAAAMAAAGSVSHCCRLLRSLLPYWRQQQLQRNAPPLAADAPAAQPQLLRPQPPHPLPDMQPFFLRQYVKGHAWDVLENYAHLLTEMALRLPYQVHKHCDPAASPFAPHWHHLLCEYMMNQQTPFLKKQVRKLLLMMCGTKERYRQLRDVHALSVHLEGVHHVVETLHFSYDSMVQLMEHLKACAEIVVARTGNWQHLCTANAPGTLSYLMGAACILEEGVAPTVLQLIQCALCPPAGPPDPPPAQPKALTVQLANNERSERERSADSDASVTVSCKFQEHVVPQLVAQIQRQISVEDFRHFIRVFLLETNSTAVRWQVHALLLAMYENSTAEEQSRLVNLMWGLWPRLPQYGRKSSQFVDLLGYFSLKTPHTPLDGYLASAVDLLKKQNGLLMSHGNGPIYSALSNYVELDGYYLESEPCLVCNNPEVPMATIKLSTVRIDSKFTTTTQIVKLVGSHTISRIGLRIGDLKRSKMVRAINVFYNNRTVQAVQELKNKPGMWHKAKQVTLQSGQTEVRIDFQLPVVACNLMMEYADFYENAQASGESLQCPRCSAAVPANPGVCANCGENVFQCHKCRAINYDEKDPFLCHACGFCKYAKFEYTLTGRACCAVDAIESDDDRKKMVAAIGLLLDKADRVYRQLVANKPLIENMLHKITEHRLEGGMSRGAEDPPGGSSGAAAAAQAAPAQVNRVIQYVAHKYCVDSKNHFDDLSKIIQRVLTCRRELVAYDRAQSEQQRGETRPVGASLRYEPVKTEADDGNCYGCALSAASHCLTLLRALASSPDHRRKLCHLGLVQELVQHNLRRGTPQSQEEVRQLICVVTRDNLEATKSLCRLVTQRITLGLVGHAAAQDHTNAVRPLVLLLGGLVKIQDSVECWEVRLRCVVRLWIWCCPYLSEALGGIEEEDSGSPAPLGAGTESKGEKREQDPHALQQVALPCLQYLHHLMQPALPPPPPAKEKSSAPEQPEEQVARVPAEGDDSRASSALDLGAWLAGKVSYAEWKRLTSTPRPPPPPASAGPAHFRDARLALKYTARWREKTLKIYGSGSLSLGDGGWLRPVVFSPSSKMARDTACQMVKSLCTGYERTKAVLLLLTNFLPEIGAAGESSEQFLQLYQSLASEAPWKQLLALRGVLSLLADLLTKEIDHLHKLEENTLTSDMAQGYALKRLTELLAMFLEDGGVRRAYKGRLMGAVLGGYLSLRRLVVQRTRLIDDTQEKLLELLEEMTTGTEAETAEFMAVCIETVKKYPLRDFRTPVFIFERLCSIIHPEENDVGEFFLTLEKDPQQEDFLQGRMLGNPYSSAEAGLGPLMRDVKNKICADCELVALLEDDNGMELLVNNKIMSLDLPVKDVYKKVWAVSGEGDAMRVVYRMRGLLGDATEEFVETLTAASAQEVDDEQLYKMANVLADCGGLEVMLERLAEAGGAGGAARPLAKTLLRLLSLCTRARRCVALLTQASTAALPALLKAAQIAAEDEATLPRPELTCQLLEIMDRILSVAAGESLESFLQFSLTFGGPEYVQALLNCTECPGIRNNSEALAHLTRVLAALVYGNDLKMAHLCQHFKSVLDLNKFDAERWAEDEFRLELFCVLCGGIERNSIGGTLKDYIISLGIVRDALHYITMHAPCVKPTLLRTDSDELKEFISKPALKYVLRFLTGLAAHHEPTQMAVCERAIPIVHRLEQVSSDEHVGSLAENLLEALASEPEAAARVREARDYTRQEKKRLAMAMREKQLGALGMRTNDKGQVTAHCSLTQQVQELGEEAGAVCCICREGYKYQPTKVLGIYTFTKRCGVDEFEVKPRKTLGYATVTHFNVVHVECHMAAVRLARVRDEWESAALQNASTRCNGLLPLWGPHVPESAFASCLARHNTYLQECTGHRDIGYQCTVHDLKLLLLRFAREKSFHEDTGGGGPLSNMQLVPCLAHMALYVINTTRVAARELTAIQGYMEWPLAKQLESAHDAEGPLYYAALALLLQPPEIWAEEKIEHLRRLLRLAQARAVSPGGPALKTLEPQHREIRPYRDYKPYLMFFSLLQMLYDIMFKQVSSTPADQWPVKLAEAIRHGDEAVLRSSEKILAAFTEQFLPCASFAEWCDVARLPLPVREKPDEFLSETFGR